MLRSNVFLINIFSVYKLDEIIFDENKLQKLLVMKLF